MSGQPLSTVQFWPLTHLGEHYYRAFTSTPKSSAGAPLVLGALGPALHAAADSTVPFHATGISGCGHVEYESYVESFYDRSKRTGQLAVESNVREWLTNSTIGAIPTHLVKSVTVTQILKGNAAVVSQPPLCGCAGPCDCLIARLSASKRKEEVRRLLNLAIASTVVIIRNALSEWTPNGMVVAGAPRTEPAAFAMLATRRYDSFKQIRVVGPWLLLAGLPEKIESPMSTLKRTVDRLNEGGLGQERFRSEFERAVGALSRAFGENPEVLIEERPGLLRIRMSGLAALASRRRGASLPCHVELHRTGDRSSFSTPNAAVHLRQTERPK